MAKIDWLSSLFLRKQSHDCSLYDADQKVGASVKTGS